MWSTFAEDQDLPGRKEPPARLSGQNYFPPFLVEVEEGGLLHALNLILLNGDFLQSLTSAGTATVPLY